MKRDLILWLAVLTGPVVWLFSFGANFAISGWVCSLHWKPGLYLVSAVAFLLTAGSGLVGWVEWHRLGRELPGETGGSIPRSRAMASGSVALSAMFTLVILAQAIVEIMLGGCE